jgi:hypothetical protein
MAMFDEVGHCLKKEDVKFEKPVLDRNPPLTSGQRTLSCCEKRGE